MSQIESLPSFKDIWLKTEGWQPDDLQQLKFQELYQEVILANRQLNLTRITEPQDFWEKHLWDSLAGVLGLGLNEQESLSVIDIGTGGGFPGVPVAIAFPNWSVTLLDSTQKKIFFLELLLDKLNINNGITLIGRAEEMGQNSQHREQYDLALIRAVAEVSVCAEYALPMLKLGGLGVLYRGNWTEEEAVSLKKAVAKLGGKVEGVKKFTTPLTESLRHCIYIRKIFPTPRSFPRGVGIPKQHPLWGNFMTNKLMVFMLIFGLILLMSPCFTLASELSQGEQIFKVHCVGCHPNGGNIIRRGKPLKMKALKGNKMDSLEAISQLVTNGKNNMSAFKDRLSEQDIEIVAQYILKQAENNWKKES